MTKCEAWLPVLSMKRITIQVAPVLIPEQHCGKRQKQHVMVKAQVMTASLVMEADYLITANAAMHLPEHKGSWFVAPLVQVRGAAARQEELRGGMIYGTKNLNHNGKAATVNKLEMHVLGQAMALLSMELAISTIPPIIYYV